MRGLYFIDYLRSFTLGNPEYTESWKATISDFENEGFDVVAFRIPKDKHLKDHTSTEIINSIEKLIHDKK
jgi:hypothetical protein